MNITCPVPSGSGAAILHKELGKHIEGYDVSTYNPWWTLAPFTLMKFRNKDADLVHTASDYAFFTAPSNVPLVITFHNFVIDEFMREYSSLLQWIHYQTDLKWFINLALNRAMAITAVSQSTADLVKQELGYRGEILVIPNGVDIDRFKPESDRINHGTEVKVLFSGNPTVRKGAHWLSDIAARLNPGIKIVVTSGLAKRWKIPETENLEVIGNIAFSDMPSLYRQADILLMPSVREGLSLSILEAMASGLPVVTTNCSSMPEQIVHGKGGFLCQIGDVEDFAHKINILAASQKMRYEQGRYNRAVAEAKYSLTQMVESYRNLFHGICTSG